VAIGDNMIGLTRPEVEVWSPRVVVVLGMNPSLFTGPGTNTFLVGTGPRRILVDTGQGVEAYLPVLERAMETAGCEGIEQILLTHGHVDHIGGLAQIRARFGPIPARKLFGPGEDTAAHPELRPLADGDRVETEGATLRAVHTPGHAPDHLCFVLEEEEALFSGDNVLGVGTTVIPSEGGDLALYLRSLTRLIGEAPSRIYPAHGPRIDDGVARIRQYLDHRMERERQILGALAHGPAPIPELVARIYVDVPRALHAAAAHSVAAHLTKLEREGRVRRLRPGPPLETTWERAEKSAGAP